jgi:hypothetical protein
MSGLVLGFLSVCVSALFENLTPGSFIIAQQKQRGMPEGPEVHALVTGLTRAGVPCSSHGKHLFVDGKDFSFGLAGRVSLTGHQVQKVVKDRVPCGAVVPRKSDEPLIGVNWVTATEAELRVGTAAWRTSRKQLGALLLDQSLISGIGICWGSEILHAAGHLHPRLPAKDQDLHGLVDAMCAVRDRVLERYEAVLTATKDPALFVNNWFHNLYAVRGDLLVVYKKGVEVPANGRVWWLL